MAGSLIANVKLDGVSDVTKQIGDVGNQFQQLGSKMQSVGKTMGDVGKKLSVAVTAPLIGIGTMAGKMAMDFETEMAKVDTVADTSNVSLEELGDSFRDLARETGTSASEISTKAYKAISAGVDTAGAVDFVRQVTKLSTAGFVDSGNAIDVLKTVLNGYSMEATEAEKVSDMLFAVQNKGVMTIDDLSGVMGRVIPTAENMNVSLENLTAGYGMLSDGGVNAAEATTGLNAMFEEIGQSGSDVDKILRDRTGQSFRELSEDGNSLGDILQIVQDEADEAGVEFDELWSRSNAGRTAMMLLGDSADEFNGVLGEMQDSTGATEEAFEKMSETSAFKFERAMEDIKTSVLEVGMELTPFIETMAGLLEDLADKVRDVAEWFGGLSTEQQETIVKTLALVAGLGPLLLGFGKVVSVVGGMMETFGKLSESIKKVGGVKKALGLVLGKLTAPITLVIASILALTAGLVYLYKNNETVRNAIDKAWHFIQEIVSVVTTHISELIHSVWGKISDFLSENQEAIQTIIDTVWNVISTVISTVLDIIVPLIQFAWESIKSATKTVWDIISTVIETVMSVILDYVQVALKLLTGDWKGAFETFRGITDTVLEGIWSIIKTVFGSIKDTISTILNVISTIHSTIWDKIFSIVNTIVNSIRDTITDIFESFKGIVTGAFNSVKSAVQEGIQSAYDTVMGFMDRFLDAGRNIVTSIADGITGAISTVTDAIGNVTGAVRDFLPFSPAKDGALQDIHKLNFGGTIAGSIDKDTGKVKKAMEDLVGGARDELDTGMGFSVSGDVAKDLDNTFNKKKINGEKEDLYITGNNFTVREEADIDKIAKEIARQKNKRRGHKGKST